MARENERDRQTEDPRRRSNTGHYDYDGDEDSRAWCGEEDQQRHEKDARFGDHESNNRPRRSRSSDHASPDD
jgi:hypothetical protein